MKVFQRTVLFASVSVGVVLGVGSTEVRADTHAPASIEQVRTHRSQEEQAALAQQQENLLLVQIEQSNLRIEQQLEKLVALQTQNNANAATAALAAQAYTQQSTAMMAQKLDSKKESN